MAGKGSIRRGSSVLLGGFGVTGNPAAGSLISQADLVLCIGTRLTDFSTGSMSAFQNPNVKFVGLNVTGHDAYKLGALPLVADAREGLLTLLAAAQSAGLKPNPAYLQEIAAANAAWAEQQRSEIFTARPGEAMSQGQLIGAMNAEALPGDTIIAAAGGPPGDLHELWDATGMRQCFLEFGFSCMGHEIPAGLGVRMAQTAQPEGEVVVFIGDGTYLMNPTELVTALQEGLKITVVIAENHGYQIIRRLQMARVGRSFGNEFRARDAASNRLEGDYVAIDLVKNAESLGARAWHVFSPDEVRRALREARAEKRACVIVAEVEKHRYLPGGGIWWDVASAEVTQDGVTQELRAVYEDERGRLQRLYY
jgi:3D-(3,5/4)-trihydroxycyclohexane-1,2-dione acylhydrolase (decyclizing)